jgi:RHS repeat-associated protein
MTDASGEVYQHDEYFPSGETFVQERHGAEHSSYLFSGKEQDEETGLYYFGARYLDPRIGIWYGVDPLAEKYPNFSPYVYCMNNPVVYIDPDGRQTVTFGTFKRVNPFIPKSQFIGWGYLGVKENCFDYAWKQLRVVGYSMKSPSWWGENGKKSSDIYQLYLEKKCGWNEIWCSKRTI